MASLRANSNSTKSFKAPAPAIPAWKRMIDLGFCCCALPILALATFFIAALMSIASPGPIFFRQERVGYMGRRFHLYKFRTMHVGADTSNHAAYFTGLMNTNAPMQKLDARGDSRLIPFGWLLRASGMDELPQILNVFKGDMSVIGPRPCIPYEYENYSLPQRTRFHARPGLTGLWQVSGKNRTTFDRMIQLDIQYAVEKSLKLDMKILLLTVPAVLSQVHDMCRVRWSRAERQPDSLPTTGECKTVDIEKDAPGARVS
jgi:lipopolysaccharide/colanic/teichoic acid biosynthesis glycosyltransferase